MHEALKFSRRSALRLTATGVVAGLAGSVAFDGRAWAGDTTATSFTVGGPTGKVITATDFGYNAPFHFTGLYHGTLPAQDPNSSRHRFAAALRAAGIHALRFPGGNPALLYLPNGEAQTRELTSTLQQLNPTAVTGGYDPRTWTNGYYVTADNFLSFCREYGIEPIYQVNTAFYYDEAAQRTRAIVPTRYSVLKDGTVLSQYYDRDRIGEAADAIGRFVDWTRRRGYHIRYWEIGNEEMAQYDTTYGAADGDAIAIANYAAVASTFATTIRNHQRSADITISGYQLWRGSPWDTPLLRRISELGGLDDIDHVAIHYPFSQEHDPSSPQQLLSDFVTADMGIAQSISNTQADLDNNGFSRITADVTETSAYRLPKWPGVDVTPSFAHGLVWGHNFGQLIYETKSPINVKHDLESYFYGGLVYDCVLDPALDAKGKRNLHWIGPDGAFAKPLITPPDQIPAADWFRGQYFATPQIRVNSMFARAIGAHALTVAPGSFNQLVALFAAADYAGRGTGRLLLTLVNQSPDPQQIVVGLPRQLTCRPAPVVRTQVFAAGGEWGLEGILPSEYLSRKGYAGIEQHTGASATVTVSILGYSVTQISVEIGP